MLYPARVPKTTDTAVTLIAMRKLFVTELARPALMKAVT
jgi:hypothetical protein